PDCRSDIIAGEKRLKKQREREAAEAAAQAEADVAAAEQNVAQTAEAGANARSTQGASESEAGELDDGWTSHVDPGSGRTYYFNQSSNVSTWTRPAKPSAAKASDSPPPEAPSARSQGISTPQPEGVRAESKDEARPAATTAGFPLPVPGDLPDGRARPPRQRPRRHAGRPGEQDHRLHVARVLAAAAGTGHAADAGRVREIGGRREVPPAGFAADGGAEAAGGGDMKST
ncbi:hypothetical protein THAOC_16660, partial [Thalassiosira oceanica]